MRVICFVAVFASMLQWVETKKICAGSDLFDLLKLHNITKPVHLLKLPEDVINEISNRLSFSGKRHFAKVMDCLKVDPCPSDAVEVVKSNVSGIISSCQQFLCGPIHLFYNVIINY